jgi:hypothetical protein
LYLCGARLIFLSKVWCALRALLEDSIKATNTSPKKVWSAFWGSFQRFFKALCIAAKVDALVSEVELAISQGKCAVVGIQTTGEASMSRAIERLQVWIRVDTSC